MGLLARRPMEDEFAAGAYRNTRIFGPTFPFDDAALSAKLGLVIASGGDERIHQNPETGRTRYGTSLRPAPDEIFFSSCTGSTISPRGHAAARDALERLLSDRTGRRIGVSAWFDMLRARLLALYGTPGAAAVLSASGTETEYLALAFARAGSSRPLVNIVVAPQETGSGVPLAAAGRHFLATASIGGPVNASEPLAGWAGAPIRLVTVDLRDGEGRLRPTEDLDREVAERAEQALRAECDVLLHVLDASKTGVSGVSRAAARELANNGKGRVTVVVDACQLRAARGTLKSDLASGFMVMITGSKFAGGPPFCGALLVPPTLVNRFAERGDPPAGLAAYTSELDWPEKLRPCIAGSFGSGANLGLGLRWEAALAELEPLMSIPHAVQRPIFVRLSRTIVDAIAERPELAIADGTSMRLADGRPRTILPVFSKGMSRAQEARALWTALRMPMPGAPALGSAFSRICHVGQPVAVGDRWALRLCISAPMAVDVAQRIASGVEFQEALRPVRDDLTVVLDKWCHLVRTMHREKAA